MSPKTIGGKILIGLALNAVTILAAVGGSALLLSIFSPHVVSSDFIIGLARTALLGFSILSIISFVIVIIFYKEK